MSGLNPRPRLRALATPVMLLTAAVAVVPVAAGVRHAIHDGGAQSSAGVAASGTGAAHGYATSALTVTAAPAARQPQRSSGQFQVRFHYRHRSHGPKTSHPAGTQHLSSHRSPQAHVRFHGRPAVRNVGLMLLDRAVLDMEAAEASNAVLDFVNRPQNLVSTPMDKPQPLLSATRIQVFNSYAGIVAALKDHRIAPDTRAVVYDNERSTGTPANELADPVRYCRMTGQLLHGNGLEYIASPGFDLSGPRPANGEWFQQFVRAGLMKCARYADYLDIQDQLAEGTASYAKDAQTAATLLHQVNPQAKLLMGLSTSPSGHLATAGQLWRAYEYTSRYVNGYWLNLPHNISGQSVPSVAIQFLQRMVSRIR